MKKNRAQSGLFFSVNAATCSCDECYTCMKSTLRLAMNEDDETNTHSCFYCDVICAIIADRGGVCSCEEWFGVI